MKCQNCNYVWKYGGDSKYYATCPRCHYKVHVPSQVTRRKK